MSTLSRRDHFAAAAMNGILSSETRGWESSDAETAVLAVRCADALIAELDGTAPVQRLSTPIVPDVSFKYGTGTGIEYLKSSPTCAAEQMKGTM